MLKVSICISVHNTERLLPRCLDSIYSQTYNNLQVVLVNNGSTDNSENVMFDYKFRYQNVETIVYSQNDKGLAQGRQSGIDHANGDYLMFIDADDYFTEPTAVEKLLVIAETKGPDIIQFRTLRNGNIIGNKEVGLKNSKKELNSFFKYGGVQMLWLRLYKRQLFNKGVLPNIYTNNEDMFAYPCLMYSANTIYYTDDCLHVYSSDNETSVMHKYKTDPSFAQRYFNAKTKILLLPSHIEAYIGADVLRNEYSDVYPFYKSSIYVNFLSTYFKGISWSRKIDAILNYSQYSSIQELSGYIANYLPNSKLFRFFVKVLNVELACKFLVFKEYLKSKLAI